MSHNKTLAAQLYSEFKAIPRERGRIFRQATTTLPAEAYVPTSDTFIEKDSPINEELERPAHRDHEFARQPRDVIVVASVSCIYGLGSPEDFAAMRIELRQGGSPQPQQVLERLVENLYERNDYELKRGQFPGARRRRGRHAGLLRARLRVEFFGDEVESLTESRPVGGAVLRKTDQFDLYRRTNT